MISRECSILTRLGGPKTENPVAEADEASRLLVILPGRDEERGRVQGLALFSVVWTAVVLPLLRSKGEMRKYVVNGSVQQLFNKSVHLLLSIITHDASTHLTRPSCCAFIQSSEMQPSAGARQIYRRRFPLLPRKFCITLDSATSRTPSTGSYIST